MSKPLLTNEYERKYYDVEVEIVAIGTVTKRIYVDEMAQHIDTYYDCDELDKVHRIICEEVGEDEHHSNNQKFAEYHASKEVTNDDFYNVMEITDEFTNGSIEGSEAGGDEVWKCVICHEHFIGYGNNPDPIKMNGDCCNDCNTNMVIPRRMTDIMKMKDLEVK